jgi:UDP-N-acetylmuramate dehydrogenase
VNDIKRKLENITSAKNIIENAPMIEYTSFKAGGSAALMVIPQNVKELRAILGFLAKNECEHIVMGNGTNILVRDGGYPGVIVKIGEAFSYINVEGERLICGAGTLMTAIARKALSESLTGFEFASGIPGSIGGAVFMNAGAYEGETRIILEEARLVSADGTREFTKSAYELEMGYRHTLLHETGDIVTEVVLKLEHGDAREIRNKMSELAAKRNSKQPVQYPSAGSFFKRPEGHFAGKLIQDAGCKGLSVGDAEVSTLHSGFIINKGKASATDILQLMTIVRAKVMDDFGIMLEPEVRIIGRDDSSVPEYEMLYDLHTHTIYSHGTGSVEDNVRAAIDKGLSYIAISDHGPGHLFYGVNRKDFENIRNDIEKLNIKYQNMEIRFSIEANTVYGGNGLDISPEEFGEFDFVIAGFHYGLFGCGSIANWLYSHGIKIGVESLKKRNTEMIINALRRNNIAILTHPGDKGPFDIAEIARVCAETDTLIEINCRHDHLTTEEIKIAMQVPDLKFIISSDAHTPDAVGCFEPGLERALKAGLDVSRIVNIREKR